MSSGGSGEDNYPVMAAAASILASAASSGKHMGSDTASENSDRKRIEVAETVTHENRWQTMYERLKIYKVKHGNCLVPNRYAEDSQLGSWVSAQRRQYKIVTSGGNESAAMTPERAMKLRELGFEWSTSNPRNVPWETRFDELRAFVANYGHAEVPMRWEENPQLSNWVSKQRHQFKLMQLARPSRLTKARVKQLDSIGFVWEASRRRLDGADSSESESETDDIIAKAKRKKAKLDRHHHLLGESKPGAKSYGLPVFAEPRRGRMGMDPPAALGAPTTTLQGPAQDPFAAAQAMMAAGQANMGLWAAAAAGRGPPFMPPGLNPSAAAAAAQQGINPAMFYQMPPWGVMMPGGMPGGLDLAQMQKMQASMMQASMAANRQQGAGARTGDPPTDSDTGEDHQGEENAPADEQEADEQRAASETQQEEEDYL